MPLDVTDTRSNKEEQIESAARELKAGTRKRLIFEFVSRGKKRVKKTADIARALAMSEKDVLSVGKKLVNLGYIHPTKSDKRIAYEKDAFLAQHRAQIYSLADNPKSRAKFHTKRNPRIGGNRQFFSPRLPARKIRVKQVYLDDIENFVRVRGKTPSASTLKISEEKFKKGVLAITGEGGVFKDWGGERSDVYTSRVKVAGKRIATAFAFKGPGKKGKLTPAMMGKNGDQIGRLFHTPADLFVVQYWAEIDDTVIAELRLRASMRSYEQDCWVYFGVIDGQDSVRLVEAYPSKFK